MKKLILAVFAAALCTAAQAQWSAPALNRTYAFNLYNTTSAASAGTVVSTAVPALGVYSYCAFYAKLQGITGGTLDVYIQTSIDGGVTWVDVGHYPQVAAAAAQVGYISSISKWGPTVSNNPTSPPTVVNNVNGTPVIPANTFISGLMGDQLRAVIVTGAGASAGALQTVQAFCSSAS